MSVIVVDFSHRPDFRDETTDEMSSSDNKERVSGSSNFGANRSRQAPLSCA